MSPATSGERQQQGAWPARPSWKRVMCVSFPGQPPPQSTTAGPGADTDSSPSLFLPPVISAQGMGSAIETVLLEPGVEMKLLPEGTPRAGSFSLAAYSFGVGIRPGGAAGAQDAPAPGACSAAGFPAAPPAAAVGAGRRALPRTRGVPTHVCGLKPGHRILVPEDSHLTRCQGSARLCERRRAAGGDLSPGTLVTSDVTKPLSGTKASSALSSLVPLHSASFLFDQKWCRGVGCLRSTERLRQHQQMLFCL